MMVKSALVGQPPASRDDYNVLVGFARQAGIPEHMLHPEMGLRLPIQHDGDPLASRSNRVIVSMSVAIALIVIITGLRLGLRVFRRDLRVGLDDLFIVFSAIGTCAWFALTIAMASLGGAGRHIYSITYHELWVFFRLAAVGQTIFWLTVGLVGVSMTLFNRRLTGLSSRRWQYAHYTFLTLLIIYMIVSLFINLFVCRPAAISFSLADFGAYPSKPYCMNFNTVGISLSAVHIAFQFALLSVPLVILYVINLSLARKIRLGILFSMGAVACIGAVNRQVLQKSRGADITWNFPDHLAWSTVDLFFTVTAASLPVLNAALPQRLRPPSNASPRLGNLSLLQRSRNQSGVRIESRELRSRPDGTVLEEIPGRLGSIETVEHGLVPKDSFIRRTENRWDEAYENTVTRPPLGTGEVL